MSFWKTDVADASSIRRKLIHVVLTLVIPGWTAMAVVIFSFYQEERAHVLQNTVGISRALMSAVDRDLVSSIAAAQVLASSPSLISEDFSAFQREATNLLPFGFGNNFVLSDLSGQQIVNTLRPYGEPLPTHLTDQRQMLATGKPAIGDLFIGAIAKGRSSAFRCRCFAVAKSNTRSAWAFSPSV